MADQGQRGTQKTEGEVKQNKKQVNQFVQQENPAFVDERLKIFEEVKKVQLAKLESVSKREIKVKVGEKEIDGTCFVTTPFDIAKKAFTKKEAEAKVVATIIYTKKETNPLEQDVVAVDVEEDEIKGVPKEEKEEAKLIDMFRPLEGDCTLEFFTFADKKGEQVFWHSSAHLLGQALEALYGGQLCTGPSLTNGFYYDTFMGEQKISQDDYPKIEAFVKNSVKQAQTFERLVVSKEQALQIFAKNPFKVQLINAKIPDGKTATVYKVGTFIDLCTGPHIFNTKVIKAFKIMKNSGAYWLGKATNEALQRVYGISFQSDKELKAYVKMITELQENDHRNIGKKYQLFNFSDLSPGSAFFFPKGAILYNKLVQLMRQEYVYRGYQEVISPNMYDLKLWEISGHLQKYSSNMFKIPVEKDSDHAALGLKPMNCPGHCVMFNMISKSYRELPLRYADFGVLHRKELSGALTGLIRVFRFQQDDAHIYCTAEQIKQEILNTIDFIGYIYEIFGFEFEMELSTRPELKLGDDSIWDNAESQLEEALNLTGRPWKLNPGDGAFYGPKIDFKLYDQFKRQHQCGTIQLDFNLPMRFNLQYKTEEQDEKTEEEKKLLKEKKDKEKQEKKEKKKEKKEPKEEKKVEEKTEDKKDEETTGVKIGGEIKPGYARPIMIHRAILGSVERMMAILCEHTGGKWPFWISPRQCMICPISEKFKDYAKKIWHSLKLENYDVEYDDSDETLNKKVRNAQLMHYNYIGCVGAEEEQTGTVDLRSSFDNKRLGKFSLQELLVFFKEQSLPKASKAKLDFLAKQYQDEFLKYNDELNTQMFYGKNGFECDDDDKQLFEKLGKAKIDQKAYPNLYRWYNFMENSQKK